MNKKASKLLPIAASLVLAVGLAGGIAGVIAGTKDAAAPVTAIGDTEFTINDANTTIVEEGGKNILRFVSTNQAAGAVIDFAIDGTYERVGRNVMITLKDGASITSTHIRELTELAINSTNPAALKLETSRDGAKFVEVDGFNGENKTFEYPPHYFKLTAAEDVTIMQMTVFDNCTDVIPSASDFKGTWKGTITGYDYPSDVDIESDEITVTVEDDKVTGFLYFDVDAQEWNPIDLYVIDMGNPEVYLAEDPNDPQPAMVFTLAWEYGGEKISISYDDENYATVSLDFIGTEFNPSESIKLAGSASSSAEELTAISLKEGERSGLIYAILDFGATDDITWSVDKPEVVTIGENHDDELVTTLGYRDVYQSIYLNGEAAGTAILTATTGYKTAKLAVTVESGVQNAIEETPSYLVDPHCQWMGDGDAGEALGIYFNNDNSIYVTELSSYYYLGSSDLAWTITDDSYKDGTKCYLFYAYDGDSPIIELVFDESDNSLKVGENSDICPNIELSEGADYNI